MRTNSGTRSLRCGIGLYFVIAAANGAIGAEPNVPGGCETPASARTSEIGCYFVASEKLGALPVGAQYWHVYTFATRAAAEAAKGPRATVAESFGKVWLYTLAEQGWRPAGGERAAVVGPLGVKAGRNYTARYMEATFTPGMKTPAHHHPGPEAWYVVSGTQCLETPDGVTAAHAGQGAPRCSCETRPRRS